jgi:hypothetical protein
LDFAAGRESNPLLGTALAAERAKGLGSRVNAAFNPAKVTLALPPNFAARNEIAPAFALSHRIRTWQPL